MLLTPFLAAPPIIKAHLVAALAVVVLTPLQFRGFAKGSPAHRITGYIWLSMMALVAISSFWIKSTLPISVGGLGPIHILSVVALISIAVAIQAARAHQIRRHQRTLIGLSIGFAVAGVFTFMPGRIMWQIVAG